MSCGQLFKGKREILKLKSTSLLRERSKLRSKHALAILDLPPSSAMLAVKCVPQNHKKPSCQICAGGEQMVLFPSPQHCLLDEILSVIPIAA